jgi:hypothetical protein
MPGEFFCGWKGFISTGLLVKALKKGWGVFLHSVSGGQLSSASDYLSGNGLAHCLHHLCHYYLVQLFVTQVTRLNGFQVLHFHRR